VSAAIPPPGTLARERTQLGTQSGIIPGDERLMPLSRAGLTHDSACPPLRNAKTVPKHVDRPAPARRAHQFPLAISFNAATSRT
jgi:hypothetical protein